MAPRLQLPATVNPSSRPSSTSPSLARLRSLGGQLQAFAGTRLGRGVLALFAVLFLVMLWLAWPYLAAGGDIRAGLEHQPSRLWGVGETLSVGDEVSAGEVVRRLEAIGFRRGSEPARGDAGESETDAPPNTFTGGGDSLAVHLPHRATPDGRRNRETVRVSFADGRLSGLVDGDGDSVDGPIWLGAPLLASYYGDDVREVRPVELDELPQHVIDAVLAAEDDGFFSHLGVSPSGVARAALVNAKSGSIEQGGSTITQQLVKNVFLTHERSLLRKAQEAVLAFIVEVGHPKDAILQAYLNQIYLGTGDGLNYHGLGAAAEHFFGVDARDLSVAQAATLAGMIRSPGGNSPLAHPQASKERRDMVLAAMAEGGALDEEQLAAAQAEPLNARSVDLGTRGAPYFTDAMAAEARERFGLGRLGGRGYQLFSTLSPEEQAVAEGAVSSTLRRLPARSRLQGALVSVDPRDGRVLAWVGGRDYEDSQFDRVRSARRQPGSVFKPVVLAAALDSGDISPASRLDDAPLSVDLGGDTWEPRNYDGRFRGIVSVRRAIEESLNVPVVRLAQQVGLGRVRDMARRLGFEGEIDEAPSMALGAFETSPWELAGVYSALANGGQRPTLHGLAAVTAANGSQVGGDDLDTEEVLDPAVAWQVTSVLRGVVERGTGRGATGYGVAGPLAAKTGTSNGARDNWFAAYRPDRVTVVWVGHDDPQPTPLSGARAALPVWGTYARTTYPAAVPEDPPMPEGLTTVTLCRDSGRLPRPRCPAIEEVLRPGQEPTEICDLHAPGNPDAAREDGRGLWRQFKDIFN